MCLLLPVYPMSPGRGSTERSVAADPDIAWDLGASAHGRRPELVKRRWPGSIESGLETLGLVRLQLRQIDQDLAGRLDPCHVSPALDPYDQRSASRTDHDDYSAKNQTSDVTEDGHSNTRPPYS